MGRCKRKCSLDVREGVLDPLSWQGVHEVQVEIVEQAAGALRRRERFALVVHASQGPQPGRIETLDADRQTVHPGVPVGCEAPLLDGPRVGLERDLGIGGDLQQRAQVGQDAIERFRRQQARCPAAEEHTVHAPAPDVRQRLLQIGAQGIDVATLRQFPAHGVGVEVAIGALRQAPGDVHVDRQRRRVLQRQAAGPGHFDHAAISLRAHG